VAGAHFSFSTRIEIAGMKSEHPQIRYHGLDALRGAMMLLGIYLHAAVAYSNIGGWPWKDEARTSAYDITIGLIHFFRMPVFYVMAGFFAALLIDRKGLKAFLRNRALRVLIPFLTGWCVLYAVVQALAFYGSSWQQPDALERLWHYLGSGRFLRHPHPMHLWFLEYLVLLYVITIVIVMLARRAFSEGLRERMNRAFRGVLQTAWAPLLCAVPTFMTLLFMKSGVLDDPPSFIPVPRIVVAYLVFFGFGWMLYSSRDLLPGISGRAWGLLALGGAAFATSGFAYFRLPPDREFGAMVCLFLAAQAVVTWSFILGLTGLFLRYVDRPMPWVRYLSDSSYYLYLAHMPVLLVVQLVLARFEFPASAKMWIALACAVPILLVTYHFLVRPTWVGMMLNGRRYPVFKIDGQRSDA
jgi:peptidoglycan/LPS O-acetylase OafA/YrhL